MVCFSGTNFFLFYSLIFWHQLHSAGWSAFMAPPSFDFIAWFSGTHLICGMISGTRFTLSLGPTQLILRDGLIFLTPPFSVIKPLLSVVWHTQPDFLEPISFCGTGYIVWFSDTQFTPLYGLRSRIFRHLYWFSVMGETAWFFDHPYFILRHKIQLDFQAPIYFCGILLDAQPWFLAPISFCGMR